MEEFLIQSEQNQQEAWNLIKSLNIIEIWESTGATINLVGSLKMELMSKHLDIDFHVYTSPFNLVDSFAAVGKIAVNPAVKRIEYNNFLAEIDKCISWTIWAEGDSKRMWQIDIIHILKGSKYAGYFEQVADSILKVMTDEKRKTIIELKHNTPDDIKIIGIEYYKAVIKDGIRTIEQLMRWRKTNPTTGIEEWMP